MGFFQKIKRAVFLGAHTDDEMVAAGTLRKLVKAGCEVHVFAFSFAAIPNKSRRYAIDTLRLEFFASMETIGVKNFGVFDFNPGALLENQTKIHQDIFQLTQRVEPDLAFILSSEDDHQDHALLGRACGVIMRNRVPNIIRCHFPWNLVSGKRNFFVPLESDEIDVKLNCIRAYKSQNFRYDFENVYMGQARLDGYIKKGQPMESFEVVRLIEGSGQ